MSNLVPFSFESHEIRAAMANDGAPWLVAKDVAEILGYDQTANAIKLCKRASCLDELNKINGLAPATKWIPESDVYRLVMRSTLPSAEQFQDWVVEEVLPSIRKTGKYEATAVTTPDLPRPREIREAFTCCLAIAKLIGLTGNQASLSADSGTRRLTGVSALALIGQTHLVADARGRTYTPTELGKLLAEPLSGIKVNRVLEEKGLQVKNITGEWLPTETAQNHYQWQDTNKRHHDGSPVKQLKWFASILPRLGLAVAERQAA